MILVPNVSSLSDEELPHVYTAAEIYAAGHTAMAADLNYVDIVFAMAFKMIRVPSRYRLSPGGYHDRYWAWVSPYSGRLIMLRRQAADPFMQDQKKHGSSIEEHPAFIRARVHKRRLHTYWVKVSGHHPDTKQPYTDDFLLERTR